MSTADGRTYGNIGTPRRARTLGLSMASIAVVLGGVIVAFAMMLLFRVPVTFAAIALGIAVLVAFIMEGGRRQGRSRPERIVASTAFRRAERRGATTYVAGPTSNLPDGGFRAPGLLASTEMLEGKDHFGRPFAFLWDPQKRTGTVFFSTAGSGSGLRDQEAIDYLVSGWAGYLSEASRTLSLEQVAATIQTTYDPGERLPRAVEAGRSFADRESVSTFASGAVDDIVGETNTGVDRIDPRVAVTFTAAGSKEDGIDPRSSAQLLSEVSIHVPTLLERLELAGGGAVALPTAQDVIDATYVAYNPETALAVEQARLSGAGTGLGWHDVGPSYAKAERSHYEHASGFSQSFQVWQAPAGIFRENSLAAIMSPDEISEQKRVTILYRPLSPAMSEQRSKQATSDAEYEINQKGRRSSRAQQLVFDRARTTEAEVAGGAALVRFSIVITVTVNDRNLMRRVPSTVKNACSTGIQLNVRSADGNEDAAFAIGLGLGIVPAKHATFSPALREAL